MIYDTHAHSQFSFDGERTTVEKSTKAAIEKGLGGICFTDHCDFYVPPMKADFEPIVNEEFNVPAQQAEIDRVRGLILDGEYGRAAAKKFRLLKGVEIGLYNSCRPKIKEYVASHQFDEIIASVHYLDDVDPYCGGVYYKGKNWKEAYGHYLETILKEAKWLGEGFDIIGHFDYVARYAPYPKESITYHDFADLFDELLTFLAQNGKGLEINTKTYKKYGLRTPELDRDILIRFLELGGEILTLGSDAHDTERIGDKFDYYAQFIKPCGFRRLGHFENRKVKLVNI